LDQAICILSLKVSRSNVEVGKRGERQTGLVAQSLIIRLFPPADKDWGVGSVRGFWKRMATSVASLVGVCSLVVGRSWLSYLWSGGLSAANIFNRNTFSPNRGQFRAARLIIALPSFFPEDRGKLCEKNQPGAAGSAFPNGAVSP